ncbi:MAG: endonuclease/exonuclease/phosphatase family protein [Candidatus Acidiferrum sp.]|jgi:endonuclease/exonuclease/phosphatase family metal-dependent hydrolase
MKSVLSMLLIFVFLVSPARAQEYSTHASEQRTDGPELLSFTELVTLSTTAQPAGALRAHLDAVLATPFVYNGASIAGVRPRRPDVETLGPVLRVGTWNIARGLNFELIRAALRDTSEFERLAANPRPISEARKELLEKQLNDLQSADVLVLNEVDLGMKRTEYRDVARELAAALDMNYAYGVEFLEVDPIFALGTEEVHLSNPDVDLRLQQDLLVDRERYRGLHGTAILSRYPIRNARIIPLPECYDWYRQEVKGAARLEKGRRWAADKLFKERIGREVRHGGRMALVAQLAVPESPTGETTIVATHLENKCKPSCRRRQMDALLAEIKEDANPVVIAGDLNTTGKNNTPTSVRNEIMSRVTDYQFWIGQTASYFHPLGIYQHTIAPVRYFHNYKDPTALNLPILWDNREKPLFKSVERFRFADNGAFDFRGDAEHSLNGAGRTLANSNERGGKGFVPTYAFARDYGGLVGRFKLDWIFVKPFIEDPRRTDQSYFFAPHFAQTMRELNESVEGRISDHAPMTVDLPLLEHRGGPLGQHCISWEQPAGPRTAIPESRHKSKHFPSWPMRVSLQFTTHVSRHHGF